MTALHVVCETRQFSKLESSLDLSDQGDGGGVSLLIRIDCVHLIKILSNRKMQRSANCIYLEASREREYEDWPSPPSYFY